MKLHLYLTAFLVCLLAACAPAQSTPQAASSPEVVTAAPDAATMVAAQPDATVPVLPTATAVPATAVPATAVPATAAALPAPAEPPFTGIWINDSGNVLVLTGQVLYYRFTKNEAVYEHFAEVQGYDLEKGEVDFMLKRIRVNGQDAGFDAPQNKALFALDGDTLKFDVLVVPEDPSEGIRISDQFTRSY